MKTAIHKLKNYVYTIWMTLFTGIEFYLIWFGYESFKSLVDYNIFTYLLIVFVVITLLDKFFRYLTGWKVILLSIILAPIRIIPQFIALILVFSKGYRSHLGNSDIEGFGETLYYVLFTIDKEYPYGIPPSSSRSSSGRGRSLGNHDSSRQSTPRREISNAMDRIARNYSKLDTISTCSTSLDIRTSVDVSGVSTGYIVFTINGYISGTRRIPSQYDVSDVKSSIQSYLNDLSSYIMSSVESAFSSFVTDIDYSVNVRIGHIDIN